MGLGVASLQTFAHSDPAPQPGPPFTANSANNGLSVDPVTGKIVLGNDSGDVTAPARLLSVREIELFGFFLRLLDVNGGQNKMELMSNSIRIDDLPSGNVANVQVGANNSTFDLASTVPGFPTIVNLISNAGAISLQTEGNTQITMQDAVKMWASMLVAGVLHIRDQGGVGNGLVLNPVTNDVASTGTLSTQDPGGGAGKWMLGDVQAAAVALDATRYIEVDIGGVLYKLGLVL